MHWPKVLLTSYSSYISPHFCARFVSGVSRDAEWTELHGFSGDSVQPDQGPVRWLWDHHGKPGDHSDRELPRLLLPQGKRSPPFPPGLFVNWCCTRCRSVPLLSSSRRSVRWPAMSSLPWTTFRRFLWGNYGSSEETAFTRDASLSLSSSTTPRMAPTACASWASQTWQVTRVDRENISLDRGLPICEMCFSDLRLKPK